MVPSNHTTAKKSSLLLLVATHFWPMGLCEVNFCLVAQQAHQPRSECWEQAGHGWREPPQILGEQDFFHLRLRSIPHQLSHRPLCFVDSSSIGPFVPDSIPESFLTWCIISSICWISAYHINPHMQLWEMNRKMMSQSKGSKAANHKSIQKHQLTI